MEPTLAELNQKIDLLTTQLAFLTEQARLAERQRAERAELMHDLMPIVNDAYNLTVQELQEVEQYTDPADLLRLLKRLLRNGPTIEAMLEQLESFTELVQTMGPMGHEAFNKTVELLQSLETRGYFTFAKGGAQIADNIVTSFDEEDVKRLGDNVVLILNTVKDMTQPEIMGFVRSFVANVELEAEKPLNISLPALLGQMRDPHVRRGLGLTMRVLRVIGAQAQAAR